MFCRHGAGHARSSARAVRLPMTLVPQTDRTVQDCRYRLCASGRAGQTTRTLRDGARRYASKSSARRTAAVPPLVIVRKRGGSLVSAPPSLLQPGPFSGRRKANTSRPSARSRASQVTSTASFADHKCDTPRVRLLASEGVTSPPWIQRSSVAEERETPPSLLTSASRPRVSRPPPGGCGLPLHRRHATTAAAIATDAAPGTLQERRTDLAFPSPRVGLSHSHAWDWLGRRHRHHGSPTSPSRGVNTSPPAHAFPPGGRCALRR